MVPRILIADDQEVVTKALRTILECEARFTVCGVATNGAEALIKARELRPDLVILDLAMPVMNGLDAAREIAKIQPNTPVLLYTMTDVPQVRVEAASVVFARWWPKPRGRNLYLKPWREHSTGMHPLFSTGVQASAFLSFPRCPARWPAVQFSRQVPPTVTRQTT